MWRAQARPSSRSNSLRRRSKAVSSFPTQIGTGIAHLPYLDGRNPTRGPAGGWGLGTLTRPRGPLSDEARGLPHRFGQVQVRKLSIGVTASLTPALAGWVGALRRPSAKNACCFIPRGVSSHSDRALLTSDRSGLSGHSGRYALNTVFGSTTQIPVGLRNLRAWWVGGRPSCDARRHPDRARVCPPRPTGASAPRRWTRRWIYYYKTVFLMNTR